MIQTATELGPAAAAVATHCRFVPARTKKNVTSHNPIARRRPRIGDPAPAAEGSPALAMAVYPPFPRNRFSNPWKWWTPFSRRTE